MMYFKIYNGQSVVAVCTDLNFVRYQKKHKILISCDRNSVQFLLVNEKLYHDSWMEPEDDCPFEYIYTTIVSINEQEYETLRKALETEEAVPEPIVKEHKVEQESEPEDPDIEYVREMKIKELSLACREAITNGFDYNGEHYSLNVEDQIELAAQYEKAKDGLKCEYHADGEPYREYSAKEITDIYFLMDKHRTKNRIHFNELKQYVNSLHTLAEIGNVDYSTKLT